MVNSIESSICIIHSTLVATLPRHAFGLIVKSLAGGLLWTSIFFALWRKKDARP